MKFSIQTLIWTFVVIAMLIVGVLILLPDPVEVETAIVTKGDLRITVQEDGKTRIREKYIVSTPVAGRLSRIQLKVGDEVCEEGSLVAVILPAEPAMLDARSKAQSEARVEQAQAAVRRSAAAAEQVKVNYELAKAKFARAKKLIQSSAISHDEYDVTRSEYLAVSHNVRTKDFDGEIAKYELEMAKAALMQFSDNSTGGAKPFEVFAPAYGKVLRVFQESATVVSVGTPLVEMGNPQNLEMEIDVLSTDAVRIKPGSLLTIEHWGGEQPLKGTVRVVEPAAFTKISSLGVEEQRVNIIADFDEPKARMAALGDGYRVECRITINELANVLMVPNSSLFRHQKDWQVFVVEDDLAKMKPVEIGLQNELHTQVIAGLKQKDEVILYPSDKITSQTKIVRTKKVP